jgi:hypothetical protein
VNWTIYGIIALAIWGAQVTYDHLADSRGRLAPAVFYIASSLVWPFTLALVVGSALLVAWRRHRAALRTTVLELWKRARKLRTAR